jgi:hypothetical protein
MRGLMEGMEPGVHKTITNLYSWLNAIAHKSITPDYAMKIKDEIIIILCKL